MWQSRYECYIQRPQGCKYVAGTSIIGFSVDFVPKDIDGREKTELKRDQRGGQMLGVCRG